MSKVARTLLITLAVIAALAMVYGALRAAAAIGCWADWSDSSMDYRTTTYLTCQVKHPSMGWIPENRIRGTE